MILKLLIALIIIFIIVCCISWAIDTHRFVVRNYTVTDSRVTRDMRFVLLSDLHNKEYGPDNCRLTEAIDRIRPDAILIAGDMCDGLKNHDFSPALKLVERLNRDYTLYYGMGNHEYRLKIYPDQYGTMWKRYSKALEDMGLHILDNEKVYLKDSNIEISGVTIDKAFYKRFRGDKRLRPSDMSGYLGQADKNVFNLLIAHNPEYFDTYKDWGADLTVSGHVHGGIMRLPLIGGIVSPRLIEFPKYSDGLYEKDDKKMIVSCGLGTHTIHVRVFNPGELAVIDIKSKR